MAVKPSSSSSLLLLLGLPPSFDLMAVTQEAVSRHIRTAAARARVRAVIGVHSTRVWCIHGKD